MTEKTTSSKNWSDEAVAALKAAVGGASPVSAATVQSAATALDRTTRSIASKLRQLDYEVASMAKDASPTFSEAQTQALRNFVEANAGRMTYKDIAENFEGGSFTPKQVQGKLLAEELTACVKPAEKVEVQRAYTDDEEATFVRMANSGKYIEEIAEALNKSVSSARGKALSLVRSEQISKIPTQRESTAKDVVDPVTALGAAVATMTVAEIAAATDKTERGMKTLLTRRGIDCADYKGAAKKAKAEAKATA